MYTFIPNFQFENILPSQICFKFSKQKFNMVLRKLIENLLEFLRT